MAGGEKLTTALTLEVKVHPKARRNHVHEKGGLWHVDVTAPPEHGKANQAVLDVMARHWGVKKSQVEIIKGLKSRTKVVRISFSSD